jgi:hypothetical protein
MATKWTANTYLIGIPPADQEERTGLVYRGLGLHQDWDDVWSLTHLNTGHRAYTLYGLLGDVLPSATELAEAADWSFKGLNGWKADPDFLLKLDAIAKKNPETMVRAVSASNNSEEIAASIAAQRSA